MPPVKQRLKQTASRHRQRVSHHYKRVMPNKKSHRVLIWVVFLFCSAIVCAQLVYPADRSAPFAQINGKYVGNQTYQELASSLTKAFEKSSLSLKTKEGTRASYPLRSTGAELKTDSMILQIQEYSLWERLIPLSILWQQPEVVRADVYYADAVLKQFSSKASRDLTTEPKNADLIIKDGNLVATPEVAGAQITPEDVYHALRFARPHLGSDTTIGVDSSKITAEVTMADFADVKTQGEQALARPVSISVDGQIFIPTKTQVASWLKLDQNNAKDTKLLLDKAKVAEYVQTINAKVGTPAGNTNITIVDGYEVKREAGKAGRGVDLGNLIEQLGPYLLRGEGVLPLSVDLEDIEPNIIYNNKYTSSEAGLQAYLDDTTKTYNVRVMVQQLEGPKWKAASREKESTVSASTYKLFVALLLFNKMQRGEVSWDDPRLDTTVSGCFDRMTIASTNPCAESWLNEWGRTNVNNFVYSRGFSKGTVFSQYEAVRTTAADLTKYMVGLYSGTLMKREYRNRLLHSLDIHPYQTGVPAGTSADKVYNKVGFLWDYTHDSAIVLHPKGTYVITVMTKGYSYGLIASITREVELILYPR